MEIRPILSALLRNKTGAVLVVMQIAITMAVIVNALFIINERLDKMNRDPGFDVENMIAFQSWGFAEGYNHEAAVTQDVDFISSLSGVIGVTPSRALPLSNGGSANDFRATPEEEDADGNTLPSVNANYYYLNEQAIDALGVELAEGRPFYAEEINFREQNSAAFVPVVIMTKTLAKQLFDTEDALGKTVYNFSSMAERGARRLQRRPHRPSVQSRAGRSRVHGLRVHGPWDRGFVPHIAGRRRARVR